MPDRTREILLAVQKELDLRGYSDKTIKAYMGQLAGIKVF
ncbi:hypothetical protein UF75_3931 [Desulfosporosinus sp. I2]|nr:hypothetical protein UF75_3931 [Desulfosporosinus sp. I2]